MHSAHRCIKAKATAKYSWIPGNQNPTLSSSRYYLVDRLLGLLHIPVQLPLIDCRTQFVPAKLVAVR